MKTLILIVFSSLYLSGTATAQPKKEPRIQIAILLDVSGSMDNLIDQARNQIWSTVRYLNRAQCAAGSPKVELALYAYGEEAGAENGHIRLVSGFTTEVDTIAARLYRLKAKGSEEYCGLVLRRALTDLPWDPDQNTYKAIFIAGNESFEEGPYQPARACAEARAKNVIVNTIFCGPVGDTKFYNWDLRCGGGAYTQIDLDSKSEEPPTPYDSTLITLGKQMDLELGVIRELPAGQFSGLALEGDASGGYDTNEVRSLADPNMIEKYVVTRSGSGARMSTSAKINRIIYNEEERSKRKVPQAMKLAKAPPTISKTTAAAAPPPVAVAPPAESVTPKADSISKQILQINTEREAWLKQYRNTHAAPTDRMLMTSMTEALQKQLKDYGYKVKD